MRLAEPLTVWRLVAARHAARAFDGEGARLYGGRWNHPGIPAVYASATLSLAALELFVHLDAADVPEDQVAISAELPAGLDVEVIRVGDLPADWRSYPASELLKDLGTTWARSQVTALLRVPSAIIPEEPNFLLNPLHPELRQLKAGKPVPFSFDPRMLKRP